MSALRQGTRLHVAGDTAADVAARREQRMPHPVRLTEVSRLGTATDLQVPLSELVLVDQHEAQGWRVRQDERLDLLFEERCDWVRTYGRAGQLAVDAGDETLTYDELDARSNQLARYLRLHGATGGDRIALLFDRPTDSYVAVLAVLKIGATYVPLDPGTPSDRLAAIVDDSRARIVLSTSDVVARAPRITQMAARGAEFVHLDRAAPLIAEQDGRRLFDAERGNREAGFAYITYRRGRRRAHRRGRRPPQHRQLRQGRRGDVRHPAVGPRVPGPEHRGRLLRRGDLGALGHRSDAGAAARRRAPATGARCTRTSASAG